jgi:hypothetical protein
MRAISGIHVLLVSLFGIPIVWSIFHFFGRPKKNLVDLKEILVYKKEILGYQKKIGQPIKRLVDQKNIWYTKTIFGIPKKIWSTKKMRN